VSTRVRYDMFYRLSKNRSFLSSASHRLPRLVGVGVKGKEDGVTSEVSRLPPMLSIERLREDIAADYGLFRWRDEPPTFYGLGDRRSEQIVG
jgi:hypothetical protein